MPRCPSSLPPALSGGFWGTPRPAKGHSLSSQSWLFLGASSWWNISLGRCPGGGIRHRCPSWLLSMRLSFSPYLYKSAQPPWGGNSFRYPRSCPFVYYPEFTTIGESGTLVRGFRLSTWLWLQHTFPVHQPHNCRGSSSARLFSPKRCRRCLGWGKSGHLCIDCCLRLLAPEEPVKTRHHWSQPASFKPAPWQWNAEKSLINPVLLSKSAPLHIV